MKILVLPDAHASPDHHNDRFRILGKFIIDIRPDIIVSLGDFADMNSLSSYDKGKKCFEGRRVTKDIEAAIDANNKLWEEVNNYNDMRRRNRDKQYKPRKVMCLGNHEFRLIRATENDPELDGIISIDHLKYKDFGWEVVDFKVPIFIEGIAFCHHFPTGISGQPISGVNIGKSLLQKNYLSSTVGHSHLRDFYTDTRVDGKKILGLSAGSFMDYIPDFAADSAKVWWNGITVKHNVEDGNYDPEFCSLDQLYKRYKS